MDKLGLTKSKPAKSAFAASPPRPRSERVGLTFNEQHALDELPKTIAKLEQDVGRIEAALAEPDAYSRDPDRYHKLTAFLKKTETELDESEERWLALAEKSETLESAV